MSGSEPNVPWNPKIRRERTGILMFRQFGLGKHWTACSGRKPLQPSRAASACSLATQSTKSTCLCTGNVRLLSIIIWENVHKELLTSIEKDSCILKNTYIRVHVVQFYSPHSRVSYERGVTIRPNRNEKAEAPYAIKL